MIALLSTFNLTSTSAAQYEVYLQPDILAVRHQEDFELPLDSVSWVRKIRFDGRFVPLNAANDTANA